MARLRKHLLTAVVGAAATALVFAGSTAASGGTHTQSFTQNFHGTQSVTALNQCTNTLVDLTETTNSVFHVTFFPNGGAEAWGTSTEEDSFTGVDETSGVTYRGHVMLWFNFNFNQQNSNFTFTTAIHATGSDGSTITIHEVGHLTFVPDGSVSVSFDQPSLTCG